MNKILQAISDIGVVAVIRAENNEKAYKISKACFDGGITALEVTFTVPSAEKVIELLDKKMGNKAIIGAGTVLDKETCKLAIDHGARFIVSPGFDLESAKYCQEVGIPYVPGCMTITEMMTAMKHGAEVIKLFPGSAFGPGFVKSVKGPLPNIKIMPTGGVDLNNVSEWINNGCIAVGVGSKLTAPSKNDDYVSVKNIAKQFVDAVKEARK